MTVTRDGAPVANPGIGDDIYDGDLVATGKAATLTIKLDAATGMSGTIELSPETSFYLSVDSVKGEPQSLAELVAGQIGIKVKKLGGQPGLNVSTESAVCAVRGTEFEVLTSPSGAILVDCSEGEVDCSSEGQSVSAVPGQAVEKLEDAQLARTALAQADYQQFKEKWLAREETVFERNAPKAAKLIALRYLRLSERLAANHEKIAASGALRAWLREEKGARIRLSDEELDRRLAELAPTLQESRSILGTMERIAARVGALEAVVGNDSSILSQPVRPGVTVADFFKRFAALEEKDRTRIAVVRKAIRLQKRATLERASRKGGS